MSFRDTTDTEPFSAYDNLRTGGTQWDPDLASWIVTSYAGCQAVLREKLLFRHPYAETADAAQRELEGARQLTMLHGEEHARVRHFWLTALAPASVEAWSATLIRSIVSATIERFIASGSAELFEQLCERVPIRVIAGVMDLPWMDDDWIDRCKMLMDVKAEFLEGHHHDDDGSLAQRGAVAIRELNDMLRPFVIERKDGSGTDLISALWREGPTMLPDWGEQDVIDNLQGTFFGGADTTSHLIANAVYTLLTDAPLRHRLRPAHTEDVRRFAEEMLRLYGAVQFRPRIAAADTTLEGAAIAAGDPVLAITGAANRDPAKYSCPNALELARRAPRRHLAFGFGERSCIGHALAREELVEVLLAVLSQLPELRLDPDGEPPAFRGYLLRSYRPLHVLFQPS